MIGVVFPGQGSQKKGMMHAWYHHSVDVVSCFEEASDALGFDLWAVTDDDDKLQQTAYVQPLILTSSIAIWRQLRPYIQPLLDHHQVWLAGHSLGEYSAFCAAEAISLSDAVKLVHTRGLLMQQAIPEGEGRMLAVMGLEDQDVINLCEQASVESGAIVQAANFNAPMQVVVAGAKAAVEYLEAMLKTLGKKSIALNVSVPSHCELMREASEQLKPLIHLQQTSLPVVQNVVATHSHDIAQQQLYLQQQLFMSVQWVKSVEYIRDQKVNAWFECGSGNVLAGLHKRIVPNTSMFGLDSPEKMMESVQRWEAMVNE